MIRLRHRIRLTSRARERLAMICGVGAVACLGSFVVHWSRDYPIQRSLWEQNLFGDLVVVEPADGDSTGPAVNPSDSHGGRQSRSSDLTAVVEPSNAEAPVEDAAVPRLMAPLPSAAVLSTPIKERPVHEQPRFILPVTHKEAAPAPTVWLSGDIEMPSEDAVEPEHPPVTLFFVPPPSQ